MQHEIFSSVAELYRVHFDFMLRELVSQQQALLRKSHDCGNGQEWLKTKSPSEEVLISGSTLGGTNEIARSLVRERSVNGK